LWKRLRSSQGHARDDDDDDSVAVHEVINSFTHCFVDIITTAIGLHGHKRIGNTAAAEINH